MNAETKYSYQKKIKDLEAERSQLQEDVYQYRTACSEIYDGILEVMKEGKTISNSWVLGRLKRAWRKF